MVDKNEKLEDVLSGFLDEQEANRAAEDIRLGDGILRDNIPPVPGEKLLNDIKMQISEKLASRRISPVVRWARRSVSAAAAIIIIGLATAVFFPGNGGEEAFAGPVGWWENEKIKTMDAEMDDVLDRLIAISQEEYYIDDSEMDFDETELEEIEMVATNDDFWKG